MANSSYQRYSFLGGEISQLAQGRVDREQYVTSLNVCLNGHPVESGAWVRRPGTMFAGATRGGAPGRVVRFDFEQAVPYTLEFTDGFLRFRNGVPWATTNDSQTVPAISAANPAVVQTGAASGWTSGNTVIFGGLGSLLQLLQNRQFTITIVDGTHFSLTDALSGATIDGSTLGSLPAGATVSRILELTTPYVAGAWSSIISVQAETSSILLQGSFPPYILTATVLPTPITSANFTLGQLVFLDGPYLDPVTNLAQITPGGTTGIVTLTLGFPAYSATKAYKVGDFVVSSSVNYISLIDQNLNNTPVSSPAAWSATSAGAAINSGQGWLGTDVGRLVRLYSEPALWLVGTTYAKGAIVSYNPSGVPGGSTYWTSLLGSNVGNIPGTDLTNWSLTTANATVWSWGKITSLATQISQGVAGVSNIGNMSSQGGLAAAFDGVTVQTRTNSSVFINAGGGAKTTTGYVGRHFGGGSQQIASVTVYPSSDLSFGSSGSSTALVATNGITINLRAKASLPANSADGTLLGSTGAIANTALAISIASNDQVTSWAYVWVEIIATYTIVVNGQVACAELQFYAPAGTGAGNVVNLEILGPPLLYTTPIITWRLGVYSNTTGFPSCGCYHEGRLWLGGAIANRFDASVSNGIVGNTVNFAPTDQYGTVGAANGISEVFNSDGVNLINWMSPDQQGVVVGTLAGEWLIAPLQAGAMAPNNVQGRPIPKIGCAKIPPVRTEHTLVFVHRYRRKLMEGFADVFSGRFSAPNLARWAMHITKPLVSELAYTDAVTPTIWGRCDDGSWFGVVYKRDALTTSQEPTYAAFFRNTLGKRLVTSICSGPSTSGVRDALTMVTFDSSTGLYNVEVLTDVLDEGSTLLQAAYLDDAVNPTSTTTTNTASAGAPYGGLTLNGLWHLNGKSVAAWLSGLDCGNYTVANGSIFVPYGDGISAGTGSGLFTAAAFTANPAALVGFDYLSQGQTVRPATPQESGARAGPALGKPQRNHYIMAQLEGAQGISFGANLDSTLKPAIFTQPNKTPYLVNQQFSGIFRDQFTCDFAFGVMVAWQVNRGYIANVVSIGAAIKTADV